MSNRVIHIKSSSTNTSSKTKNEAVFVDVDMMAKKSRFTTPRETDEKYMIYMLLAQEHPDLEEARSFVLTESGEDLPQKYIKAFGGIDKELFLRDYELFLKCAKFNINRIEDVRAIQNSLHNIFTWIPGERILLPEFGNNLRRLLYEGITQQNTEQIIAEIRHCVSEWEPRVEIQKIVNVSDTQDTENNTVHIEVLYTIPKLTGQYLYNYPIETTVEE